MARPGRVSSKNRNRQSATAGADSAAREFVGRGRELAKLRKGLDDAISGHGRLFLIGGEPGIGKSRLAHEIGAEAASRSFDVLVGRCQERGVQTPFLVFIEIFEALLARPKTAAAFRRALGDAAPEISRIVPKLRSIFPDLPAARTMVSRCWLGATL